MYEYEYPKVDVTATMFITHKGKLLLGYRRDDVDTFPGELCLPGGFLEAGKYSLLQTATKETFEECRILIDESRWQLVNQYSDFPGVDPRGHIVNVLFHVEITDAEYTNAVGGDDIKSIIWLNIRDMIRSGVPIMAFNHTQLTEDWIAERTKKLDYEMMLRRGTTNPEDLIDFDTFHDQAAGVVSVGENVMIGGKLVSGDFKT